MWKMYGKLPSIAITDGGPWYLILKRYGIEHEIVSGGIRNYVERVIETIKDRTRVKGFTFDYKMLALIDMKSSIIVGFIALLQMFMM